MDRGQLMGTYKLQGKQVYSPVTACAPCTPRLALALALTSSYPQLKLAFQFQPSRNVVSSSSMVQVAGGGAAASEATSNVAEKDERRPSTASEAGGIGGPTTKKRRHSVLMDTSVKNFQRLLNNAGEHMRIEVENLPLRALT